MPPFLTQCPFCRTSFKVSDDQMAAASGVVRCGACMEVFIANQHRVVLKERDGIADGTDDTEDLFEGLEEDADSFEDFNDDPLFFTEDVDATETILDQLEELPGPDPVTAGGTGSQIDETVEPEAGTPYDPPYYGAQLNPAGYRFTAPAADDDVPVTRGIPPATDHEDEQAIPDDEPVADFPGDTPVVNFLDIDFVEDEDADAPAVDEAWMPDQAPAPADNILSALSFDQRSNIPELKPDLVAMESLPAATATEPFPVHRRPPASDNASPASPPPPEPAPGMEESVTPDGDDGDKTAIRGHLSGLEADDALEPLGPDNLAALAPAPVELVTSRDRFHLLKQAGLSLTILVLAAGLAAQVTWYNFDTLMTAPRYARVRALLCHILDCPPRPPIDLSQLATEELIVRSHPDIENALQVNFIFRNDANYEQLLPRLELNFADAGNRLLANRVFTPEEYLPPEMQLFTHMPANSAIQVRLELVDPGTQATSYSLLFRNPAGPSD